jgi:hypothetical protein
MVDQCTAFSLQVAPEFLSSMTQFSISQNLMHGIGLYEKYVLITHDLLEDQRIAQHAWAPTHIKSNHTVALHADNA